MKFRPLATLVRLLALASLHAAAGAQCPEWQLGMQLPGLNRNAHALKAHDDGSGTKLYVGGEFRSAGRRALSYLARWNGIDWESVGGTGPTFYVWDLEEYDDGTGLALYAAGQFATIGGVPASRVARWDGSTWSPLGSGVNGTVRALAVFDDGTGSALYAAGSFTAAGGAPANAIARWGGTSWSPLGSGVVYTNVNALEVFDDGGGPGLYAGGSFHTAGGISAQNVARWRGGAWSALTSDWLGAAQSLCVHDDGTGLALYRGGREPNSLWRFRNGSWSAVGGTFNDQVSSLYSFDDGGGSKLYAAGTFTSIGGVPVRRFARWDGSAWTQLAGGLDKESYGLGAYDDGLGGGPALYVGAGAYERGGSAGISRWTGSQLTPLGAGASVFATYGETNVLSAAAFDDGSGAGPELYFSGWFDRAGAVGVDGLARWNGWRWRDVPGGSGRNIEIMTVIDDGSGAAIYGWGRPGIGGSTFQGIGRWTGASWVPVGAGGVAAVTGEYVGGLAGFDDGSGPAIYATGEFDTADGVNVSHIARFANGSWSALGSGLAGQFYVGRALAVFDDGTGPALYVAGDFHHAGTVPANSIARWSQGSWSALGSGLQEANLSWAEVDCLAVYDDGTGPGLYAAGAFAFAGGVPAANIACWKNGAWSPVGAGVTGSVGSLLVHDDGSGPALVAYGSLTGAGGVPVRAIARWNGTSWSSLGTGIEGTGGGLASYAGGLYATGGMFEAGGRAAFRVARWQAGEYRDCDANGVDDACDLANGTSADVDRDGVPDGCQPTGAETVCSGDGSGSACPCGDVSAQGRGCTNSLFPRGALLEALGSARIGADTLRLVAGSMPNSAALYFQGTQRVMSPTGAGSVLGDGLRCAGGAVVRLGTKFNAGNASQFPAVGDPSVSASGGLPAVGGRRVYQVWYRNASPSFCTPATSNLTNAIGIDWAL